MGGVKVGGHCCCVQFHAHAAGSAALSSSSPQPLSSIFSSIVSSNKAQTSPQISGRREIEDRAHITYNFTHRSNPRRQKSPFLGANSPLLPFRRSLDDFGSTTRRSGQRQRREVLRRASGASLDGDDTNSFFTGHEEDGEFMRRLEDSASAFSVEPPWSVIEPEQPRWLDQDEIMQASVVEMKASSVDLPLSLRIIKRKKKQKHEQPAAEGCIIREARDSSVKKAFSSMVFIVRELQSYTLRMREALLYENLHGILARVQGEMNASFVWLFQQIFSCTPTLMVCVMLLLANFTVYSIGLDSAAMAAVSPNTPTTQAVVELQQAQDQRFDTYSIKSFSPGTTASVGGGGSGGGKVKPVAGDEGLSDGSSLHSSRTIIPDDSSPVSRGGDEEEEALAWNRIKEEATRMQASSTHEALMDPDVLGQMVSPVKVESEAEDPSEYWKTELVYHQELSQDPDNAMVLCNFAQFLYLVLHDPDRAEHYFKRAAEVKPADAEALDRYANFLWLARNDLGAAEEMYLEAIAADPSNSYYAANYAHFLWNTGGVDTCYPLNDSDDCN